MGLPVLYVFSHDSIGVGSNGPTHQPVEILASFRAMPNMHVLRPADEAETVECWRLALARREGPSMLALSKQPAKPICTMVSQEGAAKGGYLIPKPDGPCDLTLIATGTEVALALEGAELLEQKGVHSAVVSVPCWEAFAALPSKDREDVLGTAPRLVIEAALNFGWERWMRQGDAFLRMESYGASDTAIALYEYFGLTPTSIAKRGLELAQQ